MDKPPSLPEEGTRIKKKIVFMIIALALVWIGLLIYFISRGGNELSPNNSSSSPTVKNDKVRPTTIIVSPEDNSWHGANFKVAIKDVDIGSGLADFSPQKSGCSYIIEDLGTDKSISSFRECDSAEIIIAVGSGKVCSTSYQKDNSSQGKCMVSSKAVDKAGNESGWKSKIFNIDLVRPKVDKIVLNQSLELNQEYLFKANISDNSKITGCWFYVNGLNTKEKTTINPVPCKDENQCVVSLKYAFQKEGEYSIQFVCRDPAGNSAGGEPISLKVITNHSPTISSCRVLPVQGSMQTEFKFQVEANDPDGDAIYYSWNFGDDKTSDEQNPSHYYSATGNFEPRLIIQDSRGGRAECSTARVTVR